MKPERGLSSFKKSSKHSNSSTQSQSLEKHALVKYQSMIADAKTELVLNELVTFFMNSNSSKDHLDEIILISNRWNFVEKDFNDGIITHAKYSTLRTRVSRSLLSFLAKL